MKTRQLDQRQLSDECWGIQMWGTEECSRCCYLNTKDCGGKNIRKTGKNNKGFAIGAKGLGQTI